MSTQIRKSAIFAGCVRNCGAYLAGVEGNLTNVSRLFTKVGLVLFENDSVDDTKERLRTFFPYAVDRAIISLDGIDSLYKFRTQRLALARNSIATIVRSAPFKFYDYVVLLDFDDVNATPIDLSPIETTLQRMEMDAGWGVAFANSLGPYYDMWALRHPILCPDDIWLRCETARLHYGLSHQEAYEKNFLNRLFRIPIDIEPFEVESAFGGLGIYKMKCFTETEAVYNGEQLAVGKAGVNDYLIHYQACEHVSFHRGIRSQTNLRLQIVPFMINRNTENLGFGRPEVMSGLRIGMYPANTPG